jgi:hypothetical protein
MALRDYFWGARRGRRPHEPTRETIVYPNLLQQNAGVQARKRLAYKPTPRNLRWFSKNPYARRAINAIKNPIAMNPWEITPKKGIEMNKELERQIELAMYCFDHPNHDDTLRTLLEQITEDVLLGAGAVEMQMGGDPDRPLWMYPTDGLTIQVYPHWKPSDPDSPRYCQIVGYGNFVGSTAGGKTIDLRDDELMYLRPNPTTATPFGLGPLEVAFNTVARILGTAEFAGNVATNARPSIGVDLGDGATENVLGAFRAYWRNEVEGQGNMPIFAMTSTGSDGKTRGPSVLRFYPEGDDGLYLKYQDFLAREIGTAFDLSPQNMGIERDVNRNTSEVSAERDTKQAIKPHAHSIASHLTRNALHGHLGFTQLVFKFKGIEADDELNLAKVYEIEYRNNAITPNQYREDRGKKPIDNVFADLTRADVEIATAAARGSAQVDDSELHPNAPVKTLPPQPKPKGS